MSMKQRRNVLKKILLSGATIPVLPNSWTKPIVDSVVLPTHAQTSTAEIEIVSDKFLNGFGVLVSFIDASVAGSHDNLIFRITLEAEIDQSIIGPDRDVNEYLNIEFADLLSLNGDAIRVGNMDVNTCSDGPLTFIPTGTNIFEIEFKDLKAYQYKELVLSFYPGLCAPKFLGSMRFTLSIPS